jgi:hypothetical protein
MLIMPAISLLGPVLYNCNSGLCSITNAGLFTVSLAFLLININCPAGIS